jgi:cation diffusion facilitator CzcD-associated flavoprotein CzcO
MGFKVARTHSSLHRVPQNILIVGDGSSACDIRREIALVAKRVYQLVRSIEDGPTGSVTPREKVVRSMLPNNLLRISEFAGFASTKTSEDTTDTDIILVDKTPTSGIDFVVFCTGARFSLPFLPITKERQSILETSSRIAYSCITCTRTCSSLTIRL